MNFDCSLHFGKLRVFRSCMTYMVYLQPHCSGNEGIKKPEKLLFHAVLSGFQGSNKKAVKIFGTSYLKLHRSDLE